MSVRSTPMKSRQRVARDVIYVPHMAGHFPDVIDTDVTTNGNTFGTFLNKLDQKTD